jgi:glutathione S-transferase
MREYPNSSKIFFVKNVEAGHPPASFDRRLQDFVIPGPGRVRFADITRQRTTLYVVDKPQPEDIMLKIYGTSRSRATRVLWAAEELGLKYEHIPTAVQDAKKPEFLKINPNGHLPAIDDDGVLLCESVAINLYLAEKHGKAPFWPASIADRGRVFQWSFWAMMECEEPFITLMMNMFMRPEGERDKAAMAKASESLKAPLKVLDDHLKGKTYLLGNDFTVADLNLAGVIILGSMIQYDMSATPNVVAWIDRCLARPAANKARALP